MKRIQTRLWTSLALVLLMPLAAWSASPNAISAEVSAAGLKLASAAPNSGMNVRVLGADGLVNFEQAYKGAAASLTARDIAGERGHLPDGTYKWEATLTPRGITQVFDRTVGRGEKAIEDYLKNGNNLVAPEDNVPPGTITDTDQFRLSGTFTIENGQIVDPNTVEDDSDAAAAAGN